MLSPLIATAGIVPGAPDGGFDPAPVLGVGLALLLARWLGIAWTRATVPPLAAFGTLAAYAADAWGLAAAAGVAYAILAAAASLGRRLRRR